MHLKKLSLYGFKSFAGRVDLDLTPGIVGIVGPNGVGKSNIADALRWAMGEQSARLLRGSRMQDVIFAGSLSRKGLGYAQVSLVFDNSDQFLGIGFDEVTVTRKVYRSGDAEYMLNSVPCRLRDIIDLFSGTGLGREAYSVVEQGKIDAILSARPEDRRSIFDEASGTMRYRVQKSQAQRKLLEVQADQLRVGDVARELGRQLPLVQAQAEQARCWQELSDRLTHLDADLLSYDLSRLIKRLAVVREEIESSEDQERALTARAAECEAALEEARMRVAKAESDVEALHGAVSEARAKAERVAGQEGLAQQRYQALSDRCAQLTDTVNSQHERLAKLADEYEIACSKAKQARADYAERGFTARQAQERVSALAAARAAAEADVEECKSSLFDVLARASDLRSKVRAGEDSIRLCDLRATRVGAQLQEKQREYARVEGEVQSIAREGEKLLLQLAQAEEEAARSRAASAAAQAERKRADERVADARAEESSVAAAYASLSALQHDYEGYGRAVRALLTSAEWKRAGLLGAVGELVRAPREYERAVEAALGPAVQNIVAATSRVSEEAISFLKEKRAGRATFLPLDILRPLPATGAQIPRKARGVIGLASELAESAPEHRKAVEYLLGRVLVVQDLECGVSLVRSGVRMRMVTLDGDLISAGGAMTGGEAGDRQGGLIARARRLEELRHKLEQAKASARQAEQGRASAHELLGRRQAELEEAEGKLAALALAIKGQNEKYRITCQMLPRVADELAGLQLELESVMGEREATSAEVGRFASRLEAVDSARVGLEAELQAKSDAMSQVKAEEAETAATRSSLSADAAALGERVSAFEAAKVKAQAELESCRAELERLMEQERAVRGEAVSAKQEMAMLHEAAAASALEFEGAKEQLEAARAHRADELALANEAERAARAARRGQSVIGGKLGDARVLEARLSAEREAVAERLFTSYSLSRDDAIARNVCIPEQMSREDAQLEIRSLRSQLDQLGPVNHAAIEDSKALAERHRFLEEQLADLESAQESLGEVIRECDRVCVKQFAETFEAIRQEFSRIFQDAFGGGTADLVLEDPGNPLESGVEIVCQPPGKKLARLTLLSGGEKALTAIALLFAIMRVRPSPVCVLDEIDSALDEANLARFAELLRDVSKGVQVILITHRKRTIECADTLFGVTMEESGVSKVFSIRASDYSI